MYKRVILDKIKKYLDTRDILLFYWARQVGKTSLMKIIEKDYINTKKFFFDLENPDYLKLLNWNFQNFINFLKNYHKWDEKEKITVFIDEVQYLDNPTSFLKYFYDNYSNIKLIISWSSTFEIRWKLKDSLAGRLLKFDIYPLSFKEFLIFKDKSNLSSLVWQKNDIDLINSEMRFFYEEFIKFWWYPKTVITNNIDLKKDYLKQIYDAYIQKDIKDIGKIREIKKFNILLQLLANQSWNLLNIKEISSTVGASVNTINEWIFLLENTFVIKLISPFCSKLRQELTKMPKIFFIDNGIKKFIDRNFEITWNCFENSIFNQINNSYKSEEINFWRTQDQKEIDFIIDKIPYEVKLSYNGKKLTSLEYFKEKYNKTWNIITLEKSKNSKYNQFYPWEI